MARTVGLVDGRTLVPELSGALNTLMGAFGPEARQEKERQSEIRRLMDILAGGGEPSHVPGAILDESGAVGRQQDPFGSLPDPSIATDAAQVRLNTVNPQMGTAVRQSLQRGDRVELEELRLETRKGVARTLSIQQQPDFLGRKRAIAEAAQKAAAEGEDISRLVELSNLPEAQLNLELQKMLIQGEDLETLTTNSLEPPLQQAEPRQPNRSAQQREALIRLAALDPAAAKAIQQAFQQQETFTPVRDPQGNIVGQQSSLTGQVIADPRTGRGAADTSAFLNVGTGKIQNLTDQQAGQSQSELVPLSNLKDVSVSQDAQGKLSVQFQPEADPDQRQQKIQNLTEQLRPMLGAGAETEATNVIDGLKRIEVSDDGTRVSLIDDTAALRGRPKEAVTELEVKRLERPQRVPLARGDEGLFKEVGQATGIVPTLASIGANIAGLFGADIEEPFTEAIQNLTISTNDLIRSLAINPKLTSTEIKRITDEIDIKPGLFKSPSSLRKKMISLDKRLSLRAKQARLDAIDLTLSDDTRASQSTNASSIENFLDQLNVFQGSIPERVTGEAGKRFSGVSDKEINFGLGL